MIWSRCGWVHGYHIVWVCWEDVRVGHYQMPMRSPGYLHQTGCGGQMNVWGHLLSAGAESHTNMPSKSHVDMMSVYWTYQDGSRYACRKCAPLFCRRHIEWYWTVVGCEVHVTLLVYRWDDRLSPVTRKAAKFQRLSADWCDWSLVKFQVPVPSKTRQGILSGPDALFASSELSSLATPSWLIWRFSMSGNSGLESLWIKEVSSWVKTDVNSCSIACEFYGVMRANFRDAGWRRRIENFSSALNYNYYLSNLATVVTITVKINLITNTIAR